MSEFECPSCETTCEVELEELPSLACDSTEYECDHCGQEMQIGWFAEIEVRSVTCELGDVPTGEKSK